MPLDEYIDEPERNYRQSQARAVGRDPSTALTPEQFERNVAGSSDPFSVDRYGELYYSNTGKPVPLNVRERVLGQTGLDPYGAEENARANTRLAEQVRAQRISEAMEAIDNYRAKINAAQDARLQGAGFAVAPGQTHFPGLGPQSPIVRAGLADPFPIQQRVAFDPNLVLDPSNQWQADLARIRAGAMQ